MYFFGKKGTDRPKSFNLRVMHTFNKIAIIIFVLAIIYKLVKSFIF